MKDEVKEGIILTVVVLVIIAVVYLLTGVLKGDGTSSNVSSTSSNSNTVTEIYSDMILAKDTFSKNEDEYMVIFFSNKNAQGSIKKLIGLYSGDLKLYKVNLDEKFNSYVMSEEENKEATNETELKIKDTTLIKISNGKITEYITEKDKILEQLQ